MKKKINFVRVSYQTFDKLLNDRRETKKIKESINMSSKLTLEIVKYDSLYINYLVLSTFVEKISIFGQYFIKRPFLYTRRP